MIYAIQIRKKFLTLVPLHGIQIVEAPEYGADTVFLELFGSPVDVVVSLQMGTYIVYKMAEKFPKDPVAILAMIMEWFAIIRANAITAPTDFMADYCKKLFRLPERKIQILPNTARLPDDFHSKKHVVNHVRRVLFVGRLEKRKSPDLLARVIPEILKEYPDTIFTFIGDDILQGPGKSSMRVYCESLIGKTCMNRVEFLGKRSHEEVEKYYSMSDIFVLPSKFESFGVVYIEAMLHQLPVIACRGAGVEGIIPDHTAGFLVKLGDIKELRDAIILLLSSDEMRLRMGKAGKEFALSNFSSPVVAKAHEAFYQSILSQKGI